MATSDRDSFALIDEHTKMLRILNGGVDASPLLDPHRLVMVTGVRPDQYLDYAALRGDASDNLPGVHGIGPKKAARLLAEFGSAAAAFDDAAAGGRRCRAALGDALARTLADPAARAVWETNCQVMAMRTDAPLGPGPRRRRWAASPLEEEAVRATFSLLDLHVPSAVRALTGKEPSAPRPVDVDASWRPSTRRSTMRFPPLRPPAEPKPTSVQEALF